MRWPWRRPPGTVKIGHQKLIELLRGALRAAELEAQAATLDVKAAHLEMGAAELELRHALDQALRPPFVCPGCDPDRAVVAPLAAALVAQLEERPLDAHRLVTEVVPVVGHEAVVQLVRLVASLLPAQETAESLRRLLLAAAETDS